MLYSQIPPTPEEKAAAEAAAAAQLAVGSHEGLRLDLGGAPKVLVVALVVLVVVVVVIAFAVLAHSCCRPA